MNLFKMLFGNKNTKKRVKHEPTVEVTEEFDSENTKQLILKVSGNYKIGSSGKIDASYICTFSADCIKKKSPKSIIVDLSTLSYGWGDEMDCILDIGKEESIKTAIIVGQNCKTAIGTLIHGINNSDPPTTEENIFDSIDDAKKWLLTENNGGEKTN